MSHVFANITLSNPSRLDMAPLKARALVDTGAMMLRIPDRMARQLDLDMRSTRDVFVADGRRLKIPYVGPIQVAFQNRFCYVGAFVLGDEVLLGAIPMEDMDLVVNPKRGEVTVHPDFPDAPHARVK